MTSPVSDRTSPVSVTAGQLLVVRLHNEMSAESGSLMNPAQLQLPGVLLPCWVAVMATLILPS